MNIIIHQYISVKSAFLGGISFLNMEMSAWSHLKFIPTCKQKCKKSKI